MDDILVFEYTGDWGAGVVFVDANDKEAVEHYTNDPYTKNDYSLIGTLKEFNEQLIEIKNKPTKRGRTNRYALEDFVVIE